MAFTMRFPRALSIRDDLSVADCMTATGPWVVVNLLDTYRFARNIGEHAFRKEEENGK